MKSKFTMNYRVIRKQKGTDTELIRLSFEGDITRAVLGFRGFRVSRFEMSCIRIG